MDYPYEGIPTVPPRKDMDHMAFFSGGCRYRVTAYPDWPVSKVSSLAPSSAATFRPEVVPGLCPRQEAHATQGRLTRWW